ncbi:MAG: hypothetical protein DMD79_00635 [Candidatus Rokuibacteriota bacterium]|nr:MAG: hypothetical protein DMD79_00635 [Candidatus Rokubacteria bacterium]
MADIGRAFAALSLIVALQVENGAEPTAGGTSRPEQHITGEGILYQGKMRGAGYRTSAPQAGARLDGRVIPEVRDHLRCPERVGVLTHPRVGIHYCRSQVSAGRVDSAGDGLAERDLRPAWLIEQWTTTIGGASMTRRLWTRREILQVGAEATGAAVAAGWPRRASAQGAGTLRIGVGALPATLDPHKNTAGISMATYFLLYNGLTRVDEAGQLQPGLAESWRWVNDRQR